MTSNALVAIMSLLAALGCLQGASGGLRETRLLWALIGSGFLLSTIGQIGSTYQAFTHQAPQTTALSSDFFFVIYGLPILLAISRSADSGLKGIFWLDGAQALLAGLLTYLQLFSSLPSFGDRAPISATNLMYLYNAENFILAGVVTLRLFSNPPAEKERLYRVLSIYLWVYAATALVLGYIELKLSLADGPQDVAWGIPFLALLAALAFLPETLKAEREEPTEHRSMALLIDNVTPVLVTLAVVMMGARIAPAHPSMGFVSITVAVAVYGLRAALLQAKFVRAQRELAASGLALVEANDRLLELSIRDALTGVHNRRHFDEALQMEWKRSIRTRQALSLLLIDVDCFKALNDRYGHQAGDECLRTVAQTLLRRLRRPGDVLARFGGEEFAVILPGADLQGAMLVAESMRTSVAELDIPNQASPAEKNVTVSIGISGDRSGEAHTAEKMLQAADAALYRAKLNGRNQCQFPPERPAMASAADCSSS